MTSCATTTRTRPPEARHQSPGMVCGAQHHPQPGETTVHSAIGRVPRIRHQHGRIHSGSAQTSCHLRVPGATESHRPPRWFVNQLASFSPDTASATSPLRDLPRPQHHWCWISVHQVAFEAVKVALVSPPVMAFFKSSCQQPSILMPHDCMACHMRFSILRTTGVSSSAALASSLKPNHTTP